MSFTSLLVSSVIFASFVTSILTGSQRNLLHSSPAVSNASLEGASTANGATSGDDDDVVTSFSLPDAEAVHGKLFEYEIPRVDGRGRQISAYQIFVGESRVLPDWLVWDPSLSKLEGVPTYDVVGTKHPMLIIGHLSSKRDRVKASNNKIVWHFTIYVSRLAHGASSTNNQDQNIVNTGNTSANWKQNDDSSSTVECTKAGSSVTKAIVVVDTDPIDLTTTDKIRLLKQIANHLRLDNKSLIVRPLVDLETLSESALVAGRGNIEGRRSEVKASKEKSEKPETQKVNQRGASAQDVGSPAAYLSFQWLVGCGDVQTRHMDVLINLEKSVSKGWLSASLGGLKIVSWYVVNNKPPRSKRSLGSRQKYGPYRVGKLFDIDFSPDRTVDIYAASGEGNLFPGVQTEPQEMIPIPVTGLTTRSRPHKQSKKPKTKRPKSTPPSEPPQIDVYVGRPFVYDLSNEAIFSNGAKDYGISSKDSNSLPPNYWIKINTTSPMLYGFPMENDNGTYEFKLSTMTKNGVATRNFRVNVLNGDSKTLSNHQFCMTLDLEYKRFIYDVESRINVANKLSQAFRSEDPGQITVMGISDGSVVYTWFNNTLPQSHCDEDGLLNLMNKFVDQSGNINSDFRKALDPYKLINASVSTFGPCSHISPRPRIGGVKSSDSGVTKDKISSDKLFYMIIGLIVAAAIILVIVFVAVLLFCRRRRKQKHEKQKQLFKSGVPSKGVPVIFAEELQAAEKDEDKKSQREDGLPDTARSTLRSRKGSDEGNLSYDKKAVPPPEYQPPRPGNRDAILKNDMDPILEGFASSTKSPMYNNDGNVFDGIKDSQSDDNHNINNFSHHKNGNFRRADTRNKQENRKNQHMIISDID